MIKFHIFFKVVRTLPGNPIPACRSSPTHYWLSHTQWILSSIPRCTHVQQRYLSTARVVVQPANKARNLLFSTGNRWPLKNKIHILSLTHNPDYSVSSRRMCSGHNPSLYSCTWRGVIQQFQRARHRLFTTGSISLEQIPPTRAALYHCFFNNSHAHNNIRMTFCQQLSSEIFKKVPE